MKKVLVTGGTRGIGLATALKFVEKGYRTAVAYFSDEESAAAAKAAGESWRPERRRRFGGMRTA